MNKHRDYNKKNDLNLLQPKLFFNTYTFFSKVS